LFVFGFYFLFFITGCLGGLWFICPFLVTTPGPLVPPLLFSGFFLGPTPGPLALFASFSSPLPLVCSPPPLPSGAAPAFGRFFGLWLF